MQTQTTAHTHTYRTFRFTVKPHVWTVGGSGGGNPHRQGQLPTLNLVHPGDQTHEPAKLLRTSAIRERMSKDATKHFKERDVCLQTQEPSPILIPSECSSV